MSTGPEDVNFDEKMFQSILEEIINDIIPLCYEILDFRRYHDCLYVLKNMLLMFSRGYSIRGSGINNNIYNVVDYDESDLSTAKSLFKTLVYEHDLLSVLTHNFDFNHVSNYPELKEEIVGHFDVYAYRSENSQIAVFTVLDKILLSMNSVAMSSMDHKFYINWVCGSVTDKGKLQQQK